VIGVVTFVTFFTIFFNKCSIIYNIYIEKSFWPFLPKKVTTAKKQIFLHSYKPLFLEGGFMDFYNIRRRIEKKDYLIVYPDFKIIGFKDIMIRGKAFYAIWDEDSNLWSTNEHDVCRLVDNDLRSYSEGMGLEDRFKNVTISWMNSYRSGSWNSYMNWLKNSPNNYHELDNELTFEDDVVTRKDYRSKRLPYPLKEGSYDSYDELIGTLYEPEEREKIEWAIGSVICGDSKSIQKFLVFYGDAGSGKSTILNIIQELFEGYYTTFDAKAITTNGNSFASDVFKDNPLVAIQHDSDLSKIEDNTKLNSIVSHEEINVNQKYKDSYTTAIKCMLFTGTNKPVKITDAKSGIIRRLIDVHPSGKRFPAVKYQSLIDHIPFELGAIASHCLEVYQNLGPSYYADYKPIDMMFKTDFIFNFVEDSYFTFDKQDGCSLKQAYDLYKQYCNDSMVDYILPKYKFREELRNYFKTFEEIARIGAGDDRHQIKNYYRGFLREKFVNAPLSSDKDTASKIVLGCDESIFDKECADCVAQYASSSNEVPLSKWSDVKTTLKDLDTSKTHYVKIPENQIVIDFDLKDENGSKSAERNLEEANKWPATYSEFSKSGAGIHLHYIYDGDVKKLSRVYSDGIEVKVFTGNSSLRRRLSKCNNVGIAHISSGLPLKGDDKMIDFKSVKSERSLRILITRNLNKEIHPGTKPSIDFINKILNDAYSSGMRYDLTDMRPKVLAFANNSSHQAEYCVKLVAQMKFKSENYDENDSSGDISDSRLVFFDVEVFPNLFLINWKYQGEDTSVVRMINPTPQEVEQLIKMNLVGFNCRRYDNHILYGRYLGYSNLELYNLSKKIINGSKNAFFGEAYNISYTDVYDFASSGHKKSLKKWEIELGLHHQELGLPWDEPVPEDMWTKVAEYCDNDVISTEAVFEHLSGDWAARQILSELSGLSVNATTNQHSTRIIFGDNKHPQSDFVYTDLSEMFPGYKYDHGKSTYRGEITGEGGYVYSDPGMYTNVALLDVASMHPSSIEALNLFGDKYTKVFSDIKNARVLIKHEDYKKAEKVLDGRLKPFVEQLESGEAKYTSKDLSGALKTVINSVYGLTSARFDNPFKDPRNVDNIVAKRGALFMIDLKHECMDRGWTVVHIKTDSIKLANYTDEMINFVIDFGKKYGYTFEHEATYDRMCIVNDAVYIAHESYGEDEGKWIATGAQFQFPYVFKTLFSKEPILFNDKCITKSVSSTLYLDLNETLKEDEHNYEFIGKVGEFCPIKPGCGGGLLVREKNDKYYAATGTKGYRWLESEKVSVLKKQDDIDLSYFDKLVDAAVKDISKYGDFEWFVSDDTTYYMTPPWCIQPEVYNPDLSQCANCSENKSCSVVEGVRDDI
jgi:energy-coupling factor transporter ATP-binding protein EcfA2